jgi:hypothetical protein
MKKNLKKLSALALVLVLVLSLSASALAAGGNDIGQAKAKELALAHFQLAEENVKFIEVRKDYDDGRLVYEVEFCEPYEVKYSCEVHSNGAVRDVDKDYARGIFEKVELFFEVLFYNLFNR